MSIPRLNNGVEPTGGSRFSRPAFLSHRRLPPVAHAWRWGQVTRMDLYAIAAYPNSGFRNEPEAQQLVTSRMKAKERRMMRLTVSSPESCASALPPISTR